VAANIEQVKLAGVTVDIDALAADGFAAISDDDRYRLKTQGVCTQRQRGVFMLRIRVPGGRAHASQLRAVAALSGRYGHASIHVTSRAGLEIHDVAIENVTTVFAELAAAGLTTKGTCGDTVRNVISCAHGDERDAAALVALEPFERLLHARIVARSDATNISRKMNVALACTPACDAHVATSDVGFVATPHPQTGVAGFALWGAGGLGATPRLAIRLVDWLPPADVLAAFEAVVAIGEKHGDRSARAKAKIKLLVDRLGADRVRELVAAEFERAKALIAAGDADALAVEPAALVPVARREPRGSRSVAALIPMGELELDAALALADAAERFADGIVYLTTDQNAELHGLTEGDVVRAEDALDAAGLRLRGRGGIADVLSCVGLEYCPLAVAASMTMGEEIALAMMPLRDDPRYADFRIHVSGCPHSCAKHQVADLGLAGAIVEYEGKRVEAFVAYVGGNAHERRLGTAFPKKLPRPLVVPALRALTALYECERAADERFSQTVARLGVERFFAALDETLRGGGRAPDVRAGRLVVVGNGMAGARFVEELTRRSSAARFAITVFGDERGGSYNRIMLSGVLGGRREPAEIETHSEAWYGEREIALRSHTPVARIDRERRVVVAADGTETPYDVLVLATGSVPFVPPVPGLGGSGVHVFRTLEDCARIRTIARRGSRAIVLGGGLLGLEAASGLRALEAEVTVVHLMPTLMEQQLDADGGRALRAKIEALGIAVRTGARSERVLRDDAGAPTGLELAGGEVLGADFIVVCCGIAPRVDLARAAGLEIARGIVVDDTLRTSDDRIYAIGECATHRGTTYGLVEPIWDHCRILAERLTGAAVRYAGSAVGTRLKVAGVNVVSFGERDRAAGDEAVTAFGADGSYRKAIARGGRLVGAQVVGDPVAAAAFSRAFTSGAPLPASLPALVFGSDAAAGPRIASATALEAESRRVCQCNDVARATILEAIANGARDVAAIGEATTAGTGCGTCQSELAMLLRASANTG
jgi:NAD(P)H-nitrite reductase large subunit